MKKGKFAKGAANKTLALLLSLVLIVGCVAGGTLAWLLDDTDAVVNTFTESNIDITLMETTGKEYQMIPGWTIDKDPKATVLAKSEDCYLFVKIEKSSNFDQFMTYAIAEGWTVNDPTVPSDVIYRRVMKDDEDQGFYILKDNQVAVKETVTKEMMNSLAPPTLTFTAYAVQLHNSSTSSFTAAKAWETINKPTAAPGLGVG